MGQGGENHGFYRLMRFQIKEETKRRIGKKADNKHYLRSLKETFPF